MVAVSALYIQYNLNLVIVSMNYIKCDVKVIDMRLFVLRTLMNHDSNPVVNFHDSY